MAHPLSLNGVGLLWESPNPSFARGGVRDSGAYRAERLEDLCPVRLAKAAKPIKMFPRPLPLVMAENQLCWRRWIRPAEMPVTAALSAAINGPRFTFSLAGSAVQEGATS